MTTEIKRDLASDLALCESATPGPWLIHGSLSNEVRQPNGSRRRRITTPPDADGLKDARFIAEAREGWPYAIRRAIAAETEVERLRAVLERMDDRKNPMMPRSQMARIAKAEMDRPTYGSQEFPHLYHEDFVDGRTLVPEYVARNLRKE